MKPPSTNHAPLSWRLNAPVSLNRTLSSYKWRPTSPVLALTDCRPLEVVTKALFRLHQNSKFFHSLSITSIFSRLHGVLNVD
jgi:hypothetical protein